MAEKEKVAGRKSLLKKEVAVKGLKTSSASVSFC